MKMIAISIVRQVGNADFLLKFVPNTGFCNFRLCKVGQAGIWLSQPIKIVGERFNLREDIADARLNWLLLNVFARIENEYAFYNVSKRSMFFAVIDKCPERPIREKGRHLGFQIVNEPAFCRKTKL